MSDPYYDNVVLLLPFDQDAPGPNGFLDYSPLKNVVNRFGNAGLSSAQSKFGGTSCYFNADQSSYLSLPASSILPTTGDFTCEGWLYVSANPVTNVDMILHFGNGYAGTSSFNFELRPDGKLGLYLFNAPTTYDISVNAVNLSAWNHWALVCISGAYKVFLNGVLQFTQTTSKTFGNYDLYIGGYPSNHSLDFLGYMDDLRITKGIARYTADFTPPGPLKADCPYTPPIFSVRVILASYRILRPELRPNFGGDGLIAGVVKVYGTPVKRRVRLYETSTGILIQEIWAGADGTYSFPGMKKGVQYTVTSLDYTNTYNDVIAARVEAV